MNLLIFSKSHSRLLYLSKAIKICLVHSVDEWVQNMKQINHFKIDICAKASKICSARKLLSGERGRKLIKPSRLVRSLLKFWGSSIKQFFIENWHIKSQNVPFFTILTIISMRSTRLESAGPITVWSTWSILISCLSLRLSDATHFFIYVSKCSELRTRPKTKNVFSCVAGVRYKMTMGGCLSQTY